MQVFDLIEFGLFWSPTSSKHCSYSSSISPTSAEWSCSPPFDFHCYIGIALHVWIDYLGYLWIHIWFVIPEEPHAQRMYLQWICLLDFMLMVNFHRRLCAVDWSMKRCVAQPLQIPSRVQSVWYSIDSYSKSGCLSFIDLVCQMESNVNISAWPHCWILQKRCLQDQRWCKEYSILITQRRSNPTCCQFNSSNMSFYNEVQSSCCRLDCKSKKKIKAKKI